MHVWRFADTTWTLDRPFFLGIINATPDSFSDGGRHAVPEAVAERARWLVERGADALDVGGESTRPGAGRINAQEQIERVIPAIRSIRAAGINAPISVDTTRAEVAEAALDAGAAIINDVSGGTEEPGILRLAAERGAGMILMHWLRPPDRERASTDMPREPVYEGGVVMAVMRSLGERLAAARAAGIEPERVLLDPGLGFGKSVRQNYELLTAEADELGGGRPVLGAASRKSFVGRAVAEMCGGEAPPAADRDLASAAASAIQWRNGVRIFRVHDPLPHRHTIAIEGMAAACGTTPRERGVE